jgi:phosphatidate cytidylyltransferase
MISLSIFLLVIYAAYMLLEKQFFIAALFYIIHCVFLFEIGNLSVDIKTKISHYLIYILSSIHVAYNMSLHLVAVALFSATIAVAIALFAQPIVDKNFFRKYFMVLLATHIVIIGWNLLIDAVPDFLSNLDHVTDTKIFWPLTIAILVDVLGYFFGRFTPSISLGLSISPKKTLNGYCAAILGTIFCSYLYCTLSHKNFYFFYILLLIFMSIVGDLFFSLLKRLFDLKDYSSALPGHGGFIDRCDSVFFATMTGYLLLS